MKYKKRIVQVVEYNPNWPAMFLAESQLLRDTLGEQVVDIHHIGSTSVPGLAAKPIIDILLEVLDVFTLDSFDQDMIGIGYIPRGELGIPGRRFYIKGGQDRTHHIHAFNSGSEGSVRHIAFRDYLTAHPEIARQYAELKKRCARECDNDSEKYCDLKDGFVKRHEALALEWKRRG